MSEATLLTQIRAIIDVDVDSMDASAAARLTSTSGIRFQDMTSNQAIVHGQVVLPANEILLQNTRKFIADKGIDVHQDDGALKAIDFLTVQLAKSVLPYLHGRVHAQVSPATAYETKKTVEHARNLVALFEENGVSRDQVCIKIPATPESMVACQQLEAEGIRTLATCLFSVAQAVSASQAGCLYVAPYFNELAVHFTQGVWKSYADTANEHPMSSVIYAIVQAFKELRSKTLVMPASIVNTTEASIQNMPMNKNVIGLARLRPNHLTISAQVLDAMALPGSEVSDNELAPAQIDIVTRNEVITTDYLDNGAAALRQAIANDAEATRKLKDALLIFGKKEDETKAFIRAYLTKPA
ncbi:aldolase [Hygrophoropsis aurantiaca]|uniref:Aldolase n=1 Tax=Hygrophoropsis aurantiaca TaxID=72124 RepID=A0ACB8AEQ0_9AGAM|nr:aldolase [Hygrophoropsis aurantiaca]